MAFPGCACCGLPFSAEDAIALPARFRFAARAAAQGDFCMPKNAALILAAGKGTRMHSDRPKVLQTILGEPMLAYVRAALRPVFAEDVWMVVGHRAQMV